MEVLQEVSVAEAVPYVVDAVIDRYFSAPAIRSNWFIAPFYEGDALTFENEIPPGIIQSLARVHAYFAKKGEGRRSHNGL
jgi:hypothetical protein